jgi:hypothetical protein
MKTITKPVTFAAAFTLAALLLNGCAGPAVPNQNCLQRPLRVAIVPGINKTDQPKANMVFDKAWEEALTKLGYQVVDADRVVTYAAASGITLNQVLKTDTAKLGNDLKVDAILTTEILHWKNSYKVVKADSTVSGIGRLVEASTGAIIWEHHWVYQEQSGNGGNNGVLGLLVDAAVTAVVNSATDAPTRLAKQGVAMSAGTVPRPGYAP